MAKIIGASAAKPAEYPILSLKVSRIVIRAKEPTMLPMIEIGWVSLLPILMPLSKCLFCHTDRMVVWVSPDAQANPPMTTSPVKLAGSPKTAVVLTRRT